MPLSRVSGIAVAAVMTAASSAWAQTPAQTSTQPTVTAATQTFAGCLMKESDYRRAHNLGEGAIGGVGLGDEFVLVDVTVSPAKSTAMTMTSSSAVSSSAATTSSAANATNAETSAAATPNACADRGVAYRLTGSDEEQLKNLVGRHIEVQGRFKDASTVASTGASSSVTTGAATTAAPVDKLPAEVEMLSFSEAPAPAATAAVSDPVPTTTPTTPVTATPPARPAATVDTPRTPLTTPAEPVASPVPERRELPSTASPLALLGVIGILALGSGVALTSTRRRAV